MEQKIQLLTRISMGREPAGKGGVVFARKIERREHP
jgi:hypothetical protein